MDRAGIIYWLHLADKVVKLESQEDPIHASCLKTAVQGFLFHVLEFGLPHNMATLEQSNLMGEAAVSVVSG